MKNRERVFYFALLILQFAAVLYILNLNRELAAQINIPGADKVIRSRPVFCSFNTVGDKMFHFTKYSGTWHLMAAVSPSCNKCEPFLKQLNQDVMENRLNENFEISALTSGDIDKYKKFEHISFYKLSQEDIYQFGDSVPVLFLVNGKGEILYKCSVFQENYLGRILEIYNKLKSGRSTKIM